MNEALSIELIPAAEIEALHADAGAAVSLALAGEPEDGMAVILAGLERAERLGGQEPWGRELLACYHRAAAAFSYRYRVHPAPQPLTPI